MLIGNREGLLALRAAVDAALDKGESFIEAYEIEFAYIRLCDQGYPDPKASPAPVAPTAGRDMGDKLASLGCLIVFMGVAAIFLTGCVRIIQLIYQ